jgi:hypothetical protein
MANKVKMLTLLQERRGYAKIMDRTPSPKPGVLFLMKLRARATHNNAPKRRLSILVDTSENANTPLPIKIVHLNPASASSALQVTVG